MTLRVDASQLQRLASAFACLFSRVPRRWDSALWLKSGQLQRLEQEKHNLERAMVVLPLLVSCRAMPKGDADLLQGGQGCSSAVEHLGGMQWQIDDYLA